MSGKRFFDLCVASAAVLVLAPLLMLIALGVLVGLGRPVFFRQWRPGLGGKPFLLSKFRTMRTGQGSDEERMGRFGRLLRSTSLDELPELWNVLKGEMSLVGPRPLLLSYLSRYNGRQARRHEIPPGLTGWAQVSGRNALSWEERLELDVWYVENRTFWLDLKILVMTFWIVLRREGVSAKGSVTMHEFSGTPPSDV
ncbi:MAG: sugar transferase [Bdellovibrionales bacterium]|nr:sugar transferase [Bdellovibrionales bacterium]